MIFEAPSVILATGGIGKSFKVTSNSWEYTGDGHALALRAGASLINMEFVQFHPTGMVWPPSVKGLLVTESVRGDGGILRNSEGKRFMFDYIPEFFRSETADTEEEADRWYDDKKNNRRPPELLPRDEVARAINSEIKAGRGTPHGGIFLDIASRRDPEFIRKRLPSMYHQFKELADVDITAEPMEIGPDLPLRDGWRRGRPRHRGEQRHRPVRRGRVLRRHARLQPARRQLALATCSCSATRRRGGGGVRRVAWGRSDPSSTRRRCSPPRTRRWPRSSAGDRFGARSVDENPYTIQQDLQQTMNDLVGIIRTAEELSRSLEEIEKLKERSEHLVVEGHRQFNPGWHLSIDLRNMLLVSECIAKAALARRGVARRAHARRLPRPRRHAGAPRTSCCGSTTPGRAWTCSEQPLPVMPDELKTFFRPSMTRSEEDRAWATT